MKKLLNLFKRRKPKFGPQILMQHSWFDKQTVEAVYQRNLHNNVTLGEVKEQA